MQSFKLLLIVWHKRFRYFNFPTLRKHLTWHNIHYEDYESRCDSCERAKITKHYNRTSQYRAKRPYQFVYIDLIGSITCISFGTERYTFTFINDHIRITEIYTGKRKSKWLKSLKAFYKLIQTCTGLHHVIERLQSDYRSKLQSRKVDKWLINKGITFEPLALYSLEENGVS